MCKLRHRYCRSSELLSLKSCFFWAEGELPGEGRGYGLVPGSPPAAGPPGWQDLLADLSRNGAACLSEDSLRTNPRDSG